MPPASAPHHSSAPEPGNFHAAIIKLKPIAAILKPPMDRALQRWQMAADTGALNSSELPVPPSPPESALLQSQHYGEAIISSFKYFRMAIRILSAKEPIYNKPDDPSDAATSDQGIVLAAIRLANFRLEQSLEYFSDHLELIKTIRRLRESTAVILGLLNERALKGELGDIFRLDGVTLDVSKCDELRGVVRTFEDHQSGESVFKTILESFERDSFPAQQGLDRLAWIYGFGQIFSVWEATIRAEFDLIEKIRSVSAPAAASSEFASLRHHLESRLAFHALLDDRFKIR